MRLRLLGVCLALAVALLVLPGEGSGQSDTKPDKSWDRFAGQTASQKEVVALAKLAEAGKDISKPAAALKPDHPKLGPLMFAFRPRDKKGIGIGPPSPGDSIEQKFIALSKREPTVAVLKRDAADLLKASYLSLALAEIARSYAPAKPRGKNGKKEWDAHALDMKTASEALIKAIKNSDGGAVTKAADKLMKSCGDCHAAFRENQ